MSPADELNTFSGTDVLAQDGMDTATITLMGDVIAVSQVDEDGELHDVILGEDQASRLAELISIFLEGE